MSALLVAMLAVSAPSRFAVVVGVNEPFSQDVSALRFADDDAVLTDRLLTNAGIDTTLLVRLDEDSKALFEGAPIDGAPTPERIDAAFQRAFDGIAAAKARGERTELYFVYSGHGDVEHGEGFIALDGGRLSRAQLYRDVLSRSPADTNHVVIDACRSYFFVFPKGPGGRRAKHQLDVREGPEHFANTGFVLSTSSDRDSHEWARFRAGVFSHEVRSALYGGADVDRDGSISYAELGAFIDVANGAIPNPRFRPDAIVRAPRGAKDARAIDMLVWSDPDRRRLDLPPTASLGHMYLEDAMGVRLADAHPADGETLSLYVPPSRPLFLRGARGGREYAIEKEAPIVLAMNDAQDATIGEKGAVHLAFKRLFSKPVTKADVDAFVARQAIEAMSVTVEAPTVSDHVHAVAPWIAGGTAIAGVGMTSAALILKGSADGADQARQSQINGRIDALNTGAVVMYSTAVTAALTWLVLELVDSP